jgi:DNA-binding transcriptional LysR family regulator
VAKSEPALIAIAYRYFMAVAELGSVRAASRDLNVAASAISRQLIILEAALGNRLFDRSGRGLKLAPAGEILLRGLRRAAQSHENTLDELSALRKLTRGLLRIATVESVSASVLPDILEHFIRSYPGIQVSVTVAGSEAVTQLVREHQAELGFTFNPSSLDGLEALASRDLDLGAIMSPRHPLARAKKLSLAECAEHPLAWPSPGLSLRAILESIPSARKLRPAFECNSLRLMASLSRRGSCIAFQTVIGIERELAAGSLVFVPLSDKRLPVDRLRLVARSGAGARPTVEAFLEIVQHYLGKL